MPAPSAPGEPDPLLSLRTDRERAYFERYRELLARRGVRDAGLGPILASLAIITAGWEEARDAGDVKLMLRYHNRLVALLRLLGLTPVDAEKVAPTSSAADDDDRFLFG